MANKEEPDNHIFFVGLCWNCKLVGSRTQPLHRCGGCQLVAYCSKDCQKDDRSTHKYVCKEFPVVNGNNALYTTGAWENHIEGLLDRAARLKHAQDSEPIFENPWVCNTCNESRPGRLTDCKCGYISYCSKRCSNIDHSHKKNCSLIGQGRQAHSLLLRRMTYPTGLGYALLAMPEEEFAINNNLVVHVVTSSAIWESFGHDEKLLVSYWEEGFVHQFEYLKQLKIVFILQEKVLSPSFILQTQMNQIRSQGTWKNVNCNECKAKNVMLNIPLSICNITCSSHHQDTQNLVLLLCLVTHKRCHQERRRLISTVRYPIVI